MNTIYTEKNQTLKDMINLTFNLHKYTVISNFSDMKQIGKQHYLTYNIAMPIDSPDDIHLKYY